MVLLLVAARGVGGDGSDVGADQPSASPRLSDVEEVVVVAERLEKGAIPNQTIMVQTYSVRRRAMRLYDEQRYGEALPLLSRPEAGREASERRDRVDRRTGSRLGA